MDKAKIDEAIEKAKHRIEADEGDYFKDGLLYCGKCNTAKEGVYEHLGLVPQLCDCKAHKRQDNNSKIKNERIEKIRRQSLQDISLTKWDFSIDKYPDSSVSKFLRNYVKHWDDMKETGTGCILYGNAGTGKTFYAACVANALIDKGVSVCMTSLIKVLNGTPSQFGGDKNAYYDSFNDYQLLVLDDFGAERETEYVFEQVFYLIDSRYKAGLPMILTTNLTKETMRNEKDINKRRIYDRINGTCFDLTVKGKSKREMENQERIELAKQLFTE